MPSLAVVISFSYCSCVAKPGTMALLRPSMPIEIAPLRLTLAFSSSSTRNLGLASLALTAAIGPAVPPPMTSTSTVWVMVSILLSLIRVATRRLLRCLALRSVMPLDLQAVLEGIAAEVEIFEIQRRTIGRMREPFHAQHRAALADVQRLRQCLVGQRRLDLQISTAERDAVVVLHHEEDVARGKVCLAQALADALVQIGDLERKRLAVQVTDALDLGHRGAGFHLQPFGNRCRCRHQL